MANTTSKQEYLYTAHNSSGKKVKGKVEATTEARAYSALKSQGLSPVTVKAAASGLSTEINIPGFQKKVKIKELSVFAKQFGSLIGAGMPLVRSLQVVASQTEGRVLKRALQDTLADVEAGATLAAAMGKQDQVFPPLMVSLVRVGESGGFLDRSLTSVAKNMQSEVELRGKIKSAMIYPVIVGAIAILAVAAMLVFVVPTFVKMFDSMGAKLPLPTRILVALSENMVYIGPLALILGGGFMFWFRRNKHKHFVRARLDPLKLKVPVFGKLNSKVSIARFTRSLAMMLGAGVPLLNALDLVSAAANNYVLEEAIAEIKDEMKKGKSFAEPMAQIDVFPTIVSSMIAVGEESGALSTMLDNIADIYEEEVNVATESLSAAMEPVMIMFLGGLVGGMVVALYMPMFSLFAVMSKQS